MRRVSKQSRGRMRNNEEPMERGGAMTAGGEEQPNGMNSGVGGSEIVKKKKKHG